MTLCGNHPVRSVEHRMARWWPHIPTNNETAREWDSKPTTTGLRHCATHAMPRWIRAMNGQRMPSSKLGTKPIEKPLDGYSRRVILHYVSFEHVDVGGDCILRLIDSQQGIPLGISIHLRTADHDLGLTELFHGLL